MAETQTPEIVVIDGWTFRIKLAPKQPPSPNTLILLHGHLGNENAMWILTKPLPENFLMIAPRAPVKTGPDQYSWHEITKQWPSLDTYRELSNDLLSRIDQWLEKSNLDVKKLNLMGFSQGAVMAYAIAILHPQRVKKIAALASFIPQTWQEHLTQEALEGKKFFIAHGTQDEIIPIKKARQASKWLDKKGAQVTFCEAETGHKLSANCFNGLGEFFKEGA